MLEFDPCLAIHYKGPSKTGEIFLSYVFDFPWYFYIWCIKFFCNRYSCNTYTSWKSCLSTRTIKKTVSNKVLQSVGLFYFKALLWIPMINLWRDLNFWAHTASPGPKDIVVSVIREACDISQGVYLVVLGSLILVKITLAAWSTSIRMLIRHWPTSHSIPYPNNDTSFSHPKFLDRGAYRPR